MSPTDAFLGAGLQVARSGAFGDTVAAAVDRLANAAAGPARPATNAVPPAPLEPRRDNPVIVGPDDTWSALRRHWPWAVGAGAVLLLVALITRKA